MLIPTTAPRTFSLRSHLLALVLSATVPLLVFAIAGAWWLVSSYRSAAEADLRNTARALSLAVDGEVENFASALVALTSSEALARDDLAAFHDEARRVAAAFDSWIGLGGADGQLVLHTQRPFGAALPASTVPDIIKAVIATSSPATSDLFTSAVASEPIVVRFVPVVRDGQAVYALGMPLRPGRLSRLLAAQQLPDRQFALLVDGNNRLIARSENGAAFLGRSFPDWYRQATQGAARGIAAGPSLRGYETIVAFERLAHAPWTVMISIPLADYQARWQRPLMALAFGGVALIGLAALLALRLAGRLARPIRALAAAAADGAAADPAPDDRVRELAVLREAFDRAVVALRARAEAEGRAEAERQGARALARSEERFRTLVTTTAAIVWTCDAEGRFVEPQPGWAAYTGQAWPAHEGFGWLQAIHPDDRDELWRLWDEARATRATYVSRGRLWHAASGRHRAFVAQAAPILNEDGAVREWVGTITDIEDRRRAEDALATIIRHMPIGVIVAEAPSGRLVLANEQVAAMWRRPYRPADSMAAYADYRGFHPSGRAYAPPEWPLARALATGEIVENEEIEVLRGDDTRGILAVSAAPIRDDAGAIIAAVAAFRDITERRRAERALRGSERRFRQFAENSPDVIWVFDLERRRLEYVSAGYEQVWGAPREAILADPGRWERSLHPDDRARVRGLIGKLARAGAPMPIEYRVLRPDGAVRWVRDIGFPMPDDDGSVRRVGGLARDITAAKEAEAAQRRQAETDARLAAIVRHADEAIFVVDLGGTIVDLNPGAERMFGWAAAEIRGRDVAVLIPPDRAGEAEMLRARVAAGEHVEQFETVRVAKDGTRRDVLLSIAPIRDADGRVTGRASVAVDITERKRAEAHQRLLIDELNHRVKNTLATVLSLAAQTARGADSIAAFGASFTARVMALSRAHDLLTKSHWEGASLADVAAATLAPYRDGSGRLAIDGPAVQVSPRMALSLSMALHELATNAAKYGALSAPGGRVRVAWARQADGALTLDWAESGGPPVRPPARKGFGSRLIERGLALELDAAVALAFDPAGVRCRIAVPGRRKGTTHAAAE